ncbi:MAG: NTP transferase domain-containing protein [Pseudomonadota bacterium]
MIEKVRYDALVMAAGRGPSDPMATAFHVDHKCLVPVAGTPMLARVTDALLKCPYVEHISISIDDPEAVRTALGPGPAIEIVPSSSSAPASVLSALKSPNTQWPVLVTTADHALLTPKIVSHFLQMAAGTGADLAVGLATRDTITAELPQTRRTYMKFSDVAVSGCNLFAINSEAGLNFVRFWQQADKNRKKPWKLIGAFGMGALTSWMTGGMSLERAFELASTKLGANAVPVLLPFATAAVDVDKPEDKELVEQLLSQRPEEP